MEILLDILGEIIGALELYSVLKRMRRRPLAIFLGILYTLALLGMTLLFIAGAALLSEGRGLGGILLAIAGALAVGFITLGAILHYKMRKGE